MTPSQAIRNFILEKIEKGELRVGDALPTVREMAENFNVNPNTVSKVYRELQVRGMIYSRKGMGNYLSHAPEETANFVNALSDELHDVDEATYEEGNPPEMRSEPNDTFLTSEGLEVSEVAGRAIGPPDEDDDMEYAIKAAIYNPTNKTLEFFVGIQGIDADGFEIETSYLRGTLPPKQGRTFSDKSTMKKELFVQIRRWQFKN